MLTRFPLFRRCVVLAACCALVSAGLAKTDQWTDAEGKSFKGEAIQVLGPYALFRLPNKSPKLVPLGQLNAKDSVRFATQSASKPAAAADWADSRTNLGSDIFSNATKVEGAELVPVDLKGRPEPQLYLVCFVSNGEGKSWGVLGKIGWQFGELQKKYPNMVEGLMYGVKHSRTDQRNMATQMKVTYLVASFDDQPRMRSVLELLPAAGYGAILAAPDGTPLDITMASSDEEVKGFITRTTNLLELMRADNPRGWADREHYWMAVQPTLHAADSCAPLLIGDPLNADKLHELGVQSFDATLTVAADGKISAVKIADGAACPAELVDPIAQALQQARVVPAVDHGKYVAGTYLYRFGTTP